MRKLGPILLALLAAALLAGACQTTAQPNPHGRMPVWDGGP